MADQTEGAGNVYVTTCFSPSDDVRIVEQAQHDGRASASAGDLRRSARHAVERLGSTCQMTGRLVVRLVVPAPSVGHDYGPDDDVIFFTLPFEG